MRMKGKHFLLLRKKTFYRKARFFDKENERWYSWQQLHMRLVTASGLELVGFKLAFEKYLGIHHTYMPKLLRSSLWIRNLRNDFYSALDLMPCSLLSG